LGAGGGGTGVFGVEDFEEVDGGGLSWWLLLLLSLGALRGASVPRIVLVFGCVRLGISSLRVV
jgi:hypothetical protein